MRWKYSLKDIYSRLFYKLNPNFILPTPDINVAGAAQENLHAVFAWHDPLPFFVDLFALARKFVSRTLRV